MALKELAECGIEACDGEEVDVCVSQGPFGVAVLEIYGDGWFANIGVTATVMANLATRRVFVDCLRDRIACHRPADRAGDSS